MIPNPIRRPGSLALAAYIFLPAKAGFPADYRAWTDTVRVHVNTSAGGVLMTTALTRFPLLVRLDTSGFDFAKARGNGRDIRFSNSSGAPLPYHIERWDSAAGKAEVWVLADTLKANDSAQHLRLYSGNPAATDSSNAGAVFPASLGLVSVFHMGAGGTAGRANAVAGGAPATPVNFDGDERKPGIIGFCDSLGGAAGGEAGDYLDLGAGYGDFAGGFTYSAWIYPSATRRWSHFLDLGNGQGVDNIILARADSSNNLALHNYLQGGARSTHRVDGVLTNGQWHHFSVTITNADSTIRTYRNGALIHTGKLAARLATQVRTANWLGRSQWAADGYFQGKMDEVRISKVAHGAAWLKLMYENQRPDQSLIRLGRSSSPPPPACQASFAPPADTLVDEGAGLTLAARADCARTFSWTAVSGPAPRILDPDVKVLQFAVPRVAGDTAMVLRFTAGFGDSSLEKEVRVRVREAIPEPVFTLPATLPWNGRDSLLVPVAVTNLSQIKASRDSTLTWGWSLAGWSADTVWQGGGLLLRNPAPGEGAGTVTLCLHNGGPPICKSAEVTVSNPTSLQGSPSPAGATSLRPAPRRTLDGRLLPEGPASARRRVFTAPASAR